MKENAAASVLQMANEPCIAYTRDYDKSSECSKGGDGSASSVFGKQPLKFLRKSGLQCGELCLS